MTKARPPEHGKIRTLRNQSLLFSLFKPPLTFTDLYCCCGRFYELAFTQYLLLLMITGIRGVGDALL